MAQSFRSEQIVARSLLARKPAQTPLQLAGRDLARVELPGIRRGPQFVPSISEDRRHGGFFSPQRRRPPRHMTRSVFCPELAGAEAPNPMSPPVQGARAPADNLDS